MLHGIELEPGMKLNVYISNPERRKERTDANANAKEVYVAGLSKFTTKQDLEKRFGAVCISRFVLCNAHYLSWETHSTDPSKKYEFHSTRRAVQRDLHLLNLRTRFDAPIHDVKWLLTIFLG
jgi:hypothetical protein